MRWVYKITVAVLMACLVAACGSEGGDRLILQFLNFQDPGNDQPDAVNVTSAQVDIFQDVCSDFTGEPFSETVVSALFSNNGGSDIMIDTISIDIPNAGVGKVDRTGLSHTVVGGRCAVNASLRCAIDADCGAGGTGGVCVRTTTEVPFLFVDLITKATVDPGVYNATVTFSGEDLREERFTVDAGLTVTFANFDNCETDQ